MLKRIILAFIICQITAAIAAQVQPGQEQMKSGKTYHTKGDLGISASPDLLLSTPNGDLFAGGLKMRVFAGKKFSFDTEFMIGRHFLQLSPGIIGIPALLLGYGLGFGSEESEQTISEFLIIGACVILSVEHFSYHIPLRGYFDISPYVSFLRFRQFTNVANSENADKIEGAPCFAAGLEVNKYFGNFVLSPFVDYSIAYSGPIRGFTCGINLGYCFR